MSLRGRIFQEIKGVRSFLFLFAEDFGDGVADRRTGFLDFLLRQAGGHAHLQCRWDELLGFEVVLEGLQTGDEDAVCEALHRIVRRGTGRKKEEKRNRQRER